MKCQQYEIDFQKADRLLYQLDILENKEEALNGYGKSRKAPRSFS
jgi:hypothetical protein